MYKKEQLQKIAADFMSPVRGATHGSVVGKGALIGGAIGAGIGALKKPGRDEEGKLKGRLQNAAIGGAMGAGAGMIGGHLLHSSKPGGKMEDRINAGIDTAKETKTYQKGKGYVDSAKNKYNIYKDKKEFGHMDEYNTAMKDRKNALSDTEKQKFKTIGTDKKNFETLPGAKDINYSEMTNEQRNTLQKRKDMHGRVEGTKGYKEIAAQPGNFEDTRGRLTKFLDAAKAKLPKFNKKEKADPRTEMIKNMPADTSEHSKITGKGSEENVKKYLEQKKTGKPAEAPKTEAPKAKALKDNASGESIQDQINKLHSDGRSKLESNQKTLKDLKKDTTTKSNSGSSEEQKRNTEAFVERQKQVKDNTELKQRRDDRRYTPKGY